MVDKVMKQTVVGTDTATSKRCPKCKTTLRNVLHEDVEVDTCPACGGIWVDLIRERDLVQLKPQAFTLDELRRLRKFYKPFGKMETARYVPCPVCGAFMNRRNWGSHSGVIVDRCEEHGTWYDQGELEKIREFVALGGVEFEKYRLAEGDLSELNSKLNREVARLDSRIDSAYRRARLWSLLGF